MKTKWFGIVIVIAVVVVAVVLVVTSRDSSGTASASGYAGQVIAPADFTVADYAGKPLVVNLFGSWCPPCNAEAPDLATFAKDNPGAQVVGIASEDTQQAAEDFMAQYGLTYPLVVDDGSPGLGFRHHRVSHHDLLRCRRPGGGPPRRCVHAGSVQRLAGQGAVTRAASC